MSVNTSSNENGKAANCPECGSQNLVDDFDQGELVCRGCGLVVSEHAPDPGPDWRTHDGEGAGKRRTGMPTTFALHDKGLSTVIERVGRDASGRQLSQDTRLEMLRLRKWQIRSRTHTSADRNLVQAMAALARLADALHLPPAVRERAAVVYRQAFENGLVRGRSIAMIAEASLYAACRMAGIQRSLKDFANIGMATLIEVPRANDATGMEEAHRARRKTSSRHKKDLARCYRLLVKEMGLSMPVGDSVKCIAKIATKVEISMASQQKAIQILTAAKKKGIVAGKDPMGLAAAALYVACIIEGEAGKTQERIADAASVTEVTIRNRYKGLREALGLTVGGAQAQP